MNSSSESTARRDRSLQLLQTLCVTSVAAALAIRLFRQVSHYAVNVFFSDQWDFDDATLFQKHTVWQMFRWQHGPHHQGLGALFSKLVEPYFHWNSRAEAFLATVIVAVAAACALYLKTRLWGRLSFADLAIPLIFFTPAQFESLWVTSNFAHGPLPLLLVVLYCLSLTCEHSTTRYSLALIINFLAIYTGFGLFVGFITPAWLMLDYYLRRAAGQPANLLFIPLAIAVASLGSFFMGYVFAPAADCFSPQPRSPAEYFVFVSLMLAHFFGARGSRFYVSIPVGGVVLASMILALAVFAARAIRKKKYTAGELVPAVLIAYCLLFCAASAYGRDCFGRGEAFVSRYTEYVGAGVLGLYFQALAVRAGWARKALPGLVLLALLVGSFSVPAQDRFMMDYFHRLKANWRNCYMKSEEIEECDRVTGTGIFPFPQRTRLKQKLDYLKQSKQNLYSDLH